MTIAIGLHLGTYVMLAADTRTTWKFFGHTMRYRDDTEKVHRMGVGLITGAGYTNLLDTVRDRLKNEDVIHTNDILHAIREERNRLALELNILGKDAFNTGWIFSYATLIGETSTLRLAINHPTISDGQAFGIYPVGEVALISPAEANKRQAEYMLKLFKGMIKPIHRIEDWADESKLRESISYHTIRLARLIKVFKPHFESISDRIQIGVHRIDGKRGVSELTRIEDGKLNLNLKLD